MPKSIVFCDEHSLDRTVDYLVNFEGGQVGPRYPAPYSTYQQLQAEAAQRQTETSSPSSQKNDEPKPKKSRPRKLTWKEQRELEQIEAHIPELESKKEELEAAINSSGSDYAQLQALAEQLRIVQAELDDVELRWLELSEIE